MRIHRAGGKLWALLIILGLGTCVEFAHPAFGASGQRLNTPAARQFAEWLKAFNSGDRKVVEKYLTDNTTDALRSKVPVDNVLRAQKYGGSLALFKVEQSSAWRFVGLVETPDMAQFYRVVFEVEPGEPHRASAISIAPQPATDFPAARLNDRDLARALDRKLHDWTTADRFSGTVLLAHNNRIIFSKAYGYSNRSLKIPNTAQTRFRVGSIDKFFTAIAILQLVADRKIKLADPVGKYIRDYPNNDVGKVTIYQLLTHTGGTGDFFGPEFYARHAQLRTLDDYMALDPMRKLDFVPGERCEYSNYGYILLGVAIERVSGQSYYDYVREHIFAPAGMESTDTLPEDQEVANLAMGYMKPLGTTAWISNTNTLPNRGSSAGGGFSTSGDLLRFSQALLTHKLLSAAYTDQLISAKVTCGATRLAYGVADMRGENGSGWIGGNGGAEGMNADLRIYPKSGYVIAVLSNFDMPAADEVTRFIDRHLQR